VLEVIVFQRLWKPFRLLEKLLPCRDRTFTNPFQCSGVVEGSEDRPKFRPRNAQFDLKSTPGRLHVSPKSHHNEICCKNLSYVWNDARAFGGVDTNRLFRQGNSFQKSSGPPEAFKIRPTASSTLAWEILRLEDTRGATTLHTSGLIG
jgi:hypothetical protein